MIIAIDFDGTIVEHCYPAIGAPVPDAIKWMKIWQSNGAKLILWTMRSGKELQDAIDYCAENDVFFMGANENPTQHHWTDSPKVYAHTYIDDAAFGCPLIHPVEIGVRAYVDWKRIGKVINARLERS